MNTVIKSCLQNGFLIEPELAGLLMKHSVFDEEVSSYLVNVLCSLNKSRTLSISTISGNFDRITLILENYKSQRKDKEDIVKEYLSFLKSNLDSVKSALPEQQDAGENKKTQISNSASEGYHGLHGQTHTYAAATATIRMTKFL